MDGATPAAYATVQHLVAAWSDALVTEQPAERSQPLAERLAAVTRAGFASPTEAAPTATAPTETARNEAARRAGERLGRLLVEHRCTSPATAGRVAGLLGSIAAGDVPAGTDLSGPHVPRAATAMLAAFTTAHAEGLGRLALAGGSGRAGGAGAPLSHARFRALFTDAAVGLAVGDLRTRPLEVNEAFLAMLGYTAAEFAALAPSALHHPDDLDDVWPDPAPLVTGRATSVQVDKPLRHRDGHAVRTQLSLSLVHDAVDDARFLVTVVEDITDRHRLQTQLEHAATHDALTGLPNRALFLRHLDAAVHSRDRRTRVAVLFLDLDGFKFVNDSRGHIVGDQVLVTVASRLAATAAAHGGLIARLAGDEFVVLLTGTDQDLRPMVVADALLAALDRPVHVEGQRPVHTRASIGVVEVRASQSSARELMRAADLALHAAKEDGKGQIVAHDPSRTARQLSRFTIAMNLPGVVEREELALTYQPLLRLDTGELHSVEALLRWNHPQLGELTPGLFVRIAEESSAIVPIGRWVLRRACEDLARSTWPGVNINVSVRQLYLPTFADDVRDALERSSLDPHRLRIEITETVIMHLDDPGPLTALTTLADLGVRIVMDDFGTGYSNLAALRKLPLHELKLAGTFLDNLLDDGPPDPVDTAVPRTLVTLAHTLGLQVTAEGVQTAAQDAWVREIGCDVGQGWFYDARATPVRPAVSVGS